MHRLATTLTVIVAAAFPALAQDKVWTPAPVPNVIPGSTVAPVARAGEVDGAGRDAPLSGLPTGGISTGGATSSNDTNTVGTPSVER